MPEYYCYACSRPHPSCPEAEAGNCILCGTEGSVMASGKQSATRTDHPTKLGDSATEASIPPTSSPLDSNEDKRRITDSMERVRPEELLRPVHKPRATLSMWLGIGSWCWLLCVNPILRFASALSPAERTSRGGGAAMDSYEVGRLIGEICFFWAVPLVLAVSAVVTGYLARRRNEPKLRRARAGVLLGVAFIALVVLSITGILITSGPPKLRIGSRNRPPARWVSRPFADWPQILLTNRASFAGHTPLIGASAFLVQNRNGDVFGVTSRHLLSPAGGVSPYIRIGDLDRVLQSWRMHPRTRPSAFVAVRQALFENRYAPEMDWLVLELQQTQTLLPATPLHVRRHLVHEGDLVFLIGCPYQDRACRQNVYPGLVAGCSNEEFLVVLNRRVDLGGFSGAPVIDETGALVGVTRACYDEYFPTAQGTVVGAQVSREIFDWIAVYNAGFSERTSASACAGTGTLRDAPPEISSAAETGTPLD